MKKVSVIIPVYNMEDKISKSVESILKQTYNNIEIILIDDGSKDSSYIKCKLLQEMNKNVKVWHTENQGAGPARNYGIEMASGEYAYFSDADDLIERNAIEILVNAMNKFECDLVVCGYKSIDSKGRLINEKRYPNKVFYGSNIRSNYVNYANMESEYGIQGASWNKLFNLHKIKEKNIKYPPLKRHQDEVFISRYVEHTEKVCFIDDVLYTYLTNNLKKEWEKYPIDYSDIVGKLRNYKMDIIINWNPENKEMQNNINTEYIYNYIRAIELSYNKKFNFNKKQHLRWFIDKTSSDDFLTIVDNTELTNDMGYQKMVISYIRKKKYFIIYYLLKIKVFFNFRMNGLLRIVKRIKRRNMDITF